MYTLTLDMLFTLRFKVAYLRRGITYYPSSYQVKVLNFNI